MFRKNKIDLDNSRKELTDSERKIGDAMLTVEKEKKRQIMLCLISIGTLLILGTFLYFFVPYADDMASCRYILFPSIILNMLIWPFLWFLVGWTMMQSLTIFGIVKINRTKLSNMIHIATISILLLYLLVMLPFLIESIKCMLLFFSHQNEFSYTYQIPDFLQIIAIKLWQVNGKSSVFTLLGVILCVCRLDRQKRKHNLN